MTPYALSNGGDIATCTEVFKLHTRLRTVGIAVLAAAALLVVCLRPRVRVQVNRQLVGPQDEALLLLWRDAPLEEITAAVEASGKHVDQITWFGASFLFHAVAEGRDDVAEWLLKKGANPNGLDPSAQPLMSAVQHANVSMAKLLIAYGANPDLKPGPHWSSPRQLAKRLGNPEVIAALSGSKESRSRADEADTGKSPEGDGEVCPTEPGQELERRPGGTDEKH